MPSQKSTIVRAIFRTLEKLAPDLGARWAERIWLTIPEYRGRARPGPPPGDRFTVQVGGRTVVGTAWGDGPNVYLVHGRGGVSAQLHAFVDPLLAAGHRVVTFDALSHGASDPGALGPRRNTIPEMADALTAVVAAQGPAHAVISHSLGCASTFFALRGGLRAQRLVFLAPMAQPTPYTTMLAATLGFGERIRTRMMTRVEDRTGVPWSDFDIPTMVRRIAPPPLLTVHDPSDNQTRYADSVALAAAWPESRLVTTDNLNHWLVLRDPRTVEHAVSFASDRADLLE